MGATANSHVLRRVQQPSFCLINLSHTNSKRPKLNKYAESGFARLHLLSRKNVGTVVLSRATYGRPVVQRYVVPCTRVNTTAAHEFSTL